MQSELDIKLGNPKLVGLEPRHDQLKELVKQGRIDSYEVRGREVVLYWRGTQTESKV